MSLHAGRRPRRASVSSADSSTLAQAYLQRRPAKHVRRARLCRARRWSPRSPTWTPATSRPTSRPARVRLHAALGRAARQPDRDAVSGAVRQARHRHRPQSRGDVPRCIFRRRSSGRCGSISEIAAMATDLAEFLGGAIGLSLLFNMPLLAGMVVTAIVTYAHPAARAARLPAARARSSARSSASSRSAISPKCSSRPIDWGAGRAITPSCRSIADAERAADRRRHHRRDGHAARDLSAFRPDAGAHAGARRRRSGARWCASPTAKWSIALAVAGSRQHGHGDDGVERLPRRPSATWPKSRPPITR